MALRFDESQDLTSRLYAQGEAALHAGHWIEAEFAFRSVLEQQPNNWKAMRGLAVALRQLGQRDEARQFESRAGPLAPPAEKQARRSWLTRLGVGEFVLAVLNPGSLALLMFGSMLLPLLPWLAAIYYRIWPRRRRTLASGIIGWIFVGVRTNRNGPFVLGLTSGLIWLAILGPYAMADTDAGLRLFTGSIALFTVLCGLRIMWSIGARLRRGGVRVSAAG